jgi:TatD DNase family protein
MAKKKKRNPLPRLPSGSTIVDTHCHLEMTFARPEEMDAAVSRAAALGVCRIITVGIDLSTSRKAIIFASRYDSVYATVGIHPHNVQGLDNTSYDELEKLCAMPKVVNTMPGR